MNYAIFSYFISMNEYTYKLHLKHLPEFKKTLSAQPDGVDNVEAKVFLYEKGREIKKKVEADLNLYFDSSQDTLKSIEMVFG